MKINKNIKRVKFVGVNDRIGMLHEILFIIARNGMNITSMEVSPPDIFFKIEWGNLSWEDFRKLIKNKFKEVTEVIEVDLLNYEEKEAVLNTVINNVNEGIIAVDQLGYVIYLNKKAKQLLGVKKQEVSLHINKILPRSFYNPDKDKHDKNNLEFYSEYKKNNLLLTDIRIIKNELGVKTGSIIIFKEAEEVRRLLQSISRPSMVTFDDIIGESPKFKNAIFLAKSVAKSNSSIMLRGESGTGKELFARAIHMSSNRRKYPFVAINCAAVPDSLLESEFFGYEKGAFTGADSSGKQGLFELATQGTLFLDEIGDLSTHLQAKILRAIQDQRIRRLGDKREIPIDVRIISATNKDLESMIVEGTFRDDLYYRVNVIPIIIPPLRERKEDIPIFVSRFVNNLTKDMNKGNVYLTEDALKEILSYEWPGNVRELQNVIERAVILAKKKISIEHLMINTIDASKNHEKLAHNTVELENREFPINLPQILQKLELQYLTKACTKCNSSRDIAKALGISHTTVINKIKKYNINSDGITRKNFIQTIKENHII